MKKIAYIFGISILLLLGVFVSVAYANHSWGGYHWARTANPFTLKLGDNVTSAWDSYLVTTSGDWSQSTVLDTLRTNGAGLRNCGSVVGRVEVCSKTYGNNGWLGVASIWISGSHITKGTVKLNDTYFFNTAKYNTTAWRNLVMCQEVGHTFGLGHQDEEFSNANLGTCMDYTSDPSTNQQPNAHDYEQLVTIYSHLDSTNTSLSSAPANKKGNRQDNIGNDLENPSDWGRAIKKDGRMRDNVFEKDLEKGNKVLTHVFWAE